jgi:hypothetical protein
MNRALIAAAALLLLISSSAHARDAFAGSWDAVVTPGEDAAQAKEKEFKDVLTFKGDQFMSKAMEKHGFKAMKYEENQQYGLAATFKAEGKSEKNGSVTWTGQASANQMKGELVWKKPDGKELHYTFQATLKQ